MFKNLGPVELIFIVLIIVILFGGKKIPELMQGLGKGINEFKRASSGGKDDAVKEEPVNPKA
jgi:sec-independent protein translocase protein TatA